MKKLPCHVVADPVGNITVLVTEPVSIEMQPSVAEEFFAAEPFCEQVGFISLQPESRTVTIRMSGGEFCGNATLSSAAYACHQLGLSAAHITVNFSGIPAPLNVSVEQTGGGSYTGSVFMPLPVKCFSAVLSFGPDTFRLPVVRFPGISHVIMKEPLPRAAAEAAIREWCRELDVPALGLMLLDGDVLTPLVYVRDVDSLYWEHSCASGTCAAVYNQYFLSGKPFSASFQEPGGILSAEAGDGFLKLHGTVTFPDLA